MLSTRQTPRVGFYNVTVSVPDEGYSRNASFALTWIFSCW